MLTHVMARVWTQHHKGARRFLAAAHRSPLTQVFVDEGELCLNFSDGTLFRLGEDRLLRQLAKASRSKNEKRSRNAIMLTWELCLRYDVRGGEVDTALRDAVEHVCGLRLEVTPFLLTPEGFETATHKDHVKGNVKGGKKLADFFADDGKVVWVPIEPNPNDKALRSSRQADFDVDDAFGPTSKTQKKSSKDGRVDSATYRVILPFSAARDPLLKWLKEAAIR